jgi:hypothetical protein
VRAPTSVNNAKNRPNTAGGRHRRGRQKHERT